MQDRKQAEYSPLKAWFSALVVICAGVLAVASIMKIGPTMSLLIESGIIEDTAEGGWLVTIATTMGIILALPGGALVDRVGAKPIGIVGIILGIIGNLAGSLAPNYALLLATRVIEGLSVALIPLIGLTLISQLFPAEKRGLPMSIWSAFGGFGTLLILNAVNLIVDPQNPHSWSGVWLFCGIAESVVLVLFVLAVKSPEPTGKPHPKTLESPSSSFIEGLKSAPAWIIAVMYFCYCIGLNCILTFEPTYCTDALGLTFEQGNTYSSLFSASMIVGGLAAGAAMQRISSLIGRLVLQVISMAIATLVLAACFQVGTSLVLAFMIAGGFLIQIGQAVCFTVAPDSAASPAHVGITMGLISGASNIGGFGSVIGGTIIASFGFDLLTLVIVGFGAVSTVMSCLLIKPMMNKAV